MVILAILLAAVLAWWILRPKMPQLPEARAAVARAGGTVQSTVNKMYVGWRGRFKLRADQMELARKFRAWFSDEAVARRAQSFAAEEGFPAWLAGLSDREVEAFSRKVALFCASLNFDLGWLVNARIKDEAELKQAVEDAVILYSVAYWRSSQVQRQVKAFLAFQSWLSAPGKKANKALGQKLYAALVEKGLAATPPNLFLAPEKERQGEVVRAIREAAEAHRDVFRAMLLDVAAPNGPASASAEAAAAPDAAEKPAAEAASGEGEAGPRKRAAGRAGSAV